MDASEMTSGTILAHFIIGITRTIGKIAALFLTMTTYRYAGKRRRRYLRNRSGRIYDSGALSCLCTKARLSIF